MELPEKVIKALECLRAEKDSLKIEEAYLVGSYARGDWLRDSDLDLIIVSPIFRNLDVGVRYRVVKEAIGYGVPLEALCYTPEEFQEAKNRSIVVQDMLEYAVKVI